MTAMTASALSRNKSSAAAAGALFSSSSCSRGSVWLSVVVLFFFVGRMIMYSGDDHNDTTTTTTSTYSSSSSLLSEQQSPTGPDPSITDHEYRTTTLCNADGVCGENPSVPSPRTVHTAKTAQQMEEWWTFHARLRQDTLDYCKRHYQDTKKKKNRKPPIVFLGDSITESLRGTRYGNPADKYQEIPNVFQEMWPNASSSSSFEEEEDAKYDPLVLAISGDQVQHLLWRLQQGEVTSCPSLVQDDSAIFVILIGTNNLGAGELPSPTTEGIMTLLEYMKETVRGKVILHELLPRGDSTKLHRLCPPWCKSNGEPFDSFMPAIRMVNKALKERLYKASSAKNDNQVQLISCGHAFEANGGSKHMEVNTALFLDKLHPNGEGHKVLCECIKTEANL